LGSGGCLAVTEIIYADLVPLPQRGIIQAITAVVWASASAIGPTVGGQLATSGAWRWLFYLNLPVTAIAFVLVLIFLRVSTPRVTFAHSIKRIDWIGILVVAGSSASLTLALTWGGLRFQWRSPEVLIPLLIGIIALATFFAIEKYWSIEPMIPWCVLNNRTSISGYLGTAFHGTVSFVAIFFLPVYFQAVKGASPLQSGIDILGMAMFITPASIVCGVTVQIWRCYRPQNYLGWALIITGFSVLTILDIDSTKTKYIGCQIIVGVGLGIVWVSTQFPILAPLPFSNNAHALSFFTFVRCLSQTWGVAIGGAVLQNSLLQNLPRSFTSKLPVGVSVEYSAIDSIASIPEPLQTQVRIGFAASLKELWVVMIGISVFGLLSVPLMKEVNMDIDVDSQWGLQGGNVQVIGSGPSAIA